MLGKGLESLIPPQNSSDEHGAGQASPRANDDAGSNGDQQNQQFNFSLASTNPSDPEPQILSFDFATELPEPHDESIHSVHIPEIPDVHEVVALPTPPEINTKPSKPLIVVPKKEFKSSEKSFPGLEKDYIFHIEVSKISANPEQPRRKFAEHGIRELAYSIREFGFLQPMVVSKIEKETQTGVEVEYELIAGERRLLAAKLLGLETVPVIVRAVDLEREKLELAVIENIQREALNAIETARALTRLQEEFRMTQREIAAKLGKSREVVANTMRLLGLPLYIQEAMEKAEISESHGRLLLAISDPGAQRKLFDDILANNLTTRDLRQRVEVMKPRKHRKGEEVSPEIKMFEEKLSSELGTPVKIERGMHNGKITITFFSEEELESIVRKIEGEVQDF